VCGVPLTLTADLGVGRAKSSTQRLRAKGVRDAEVTSVNMHRLGESFVEKVSDVRVAVTSLGHLRKRRQLGTPMSLSK
jgi:hypothetical protein